MGEAMVESNVEDLGLTNRSADDDKENVKPGGVKEEKSGKTLTKSASQIVLEQSGRYTLRHLIV